MYLILFNGVFYPTNKAFMVFNFRLKAPPPFPVKNNEVKKWVGLNFLSLIAQTGISTTNAMRIEIFYSCTLEEVILLTTGLRWNLHLLLYFWKIQVSNLLCTMVCAMLDLRSLLLLQKILWCKFCCFMGQANECMLCAGFFNNSWFVNIMEQNKQQGII